MNQPSFLALGQQKQLRKDKFLQEMQEVLPWDKFMSIVGKKYEQKSTGRPKTELLLLLKIYFLQQWYNLSDPMMEEEIYNQICFQKFLEIDLAQNIPDETVICRFRHFLERESLQEKLFEASTKLMEERGLMLKRGTIVDATIIHASGSTKNKNKKRDSDMSSTRKNNNFHFGMKTHIGVDAESGIIHSMEGTTAKEPDCKQLENLLHGEEELISGDKGYTSDKRKKDWRKKKKHWMVLDKAKPKKKLSQKQKKRNQKYSSLRAKVEHPFHVIKNLWGHKRVRYKGLVKNTCQWYALVMLANFYRVRQKLLKT